MPTTKIHAYTDYPIEALGDTAGQPAPVRPCAITGYDGDKYLDIEVEGVALQVKRGYVYQWATVEGCPCFSHEYLERMFGKMDKSHYE